MLGRRYHAGEILQSQSPGQLADSGRLTGVGLSSADTAGEDGSSTSSGASSSNSSLDLAQDEEAGPSSAAAGAASVLPQLVPSLHDQEQLQQEGQPGSSSAQAGAAEAGPPLPEQQQQHQQAQSPHRHRGHTVGCCGGSGLSGISDSGEEVTAGPSSSRAPDTAAGLKDLPSGAAAGVAATAGAAAVGLRLGPAASVVLSVAAGKEPGPSGGNGKRRPDPLQPGSPRAPRMAPPGSTTMDEVLGSGRGVYVAAMLERLQQLPWRRVDVCFGRSLLPFLSHQHIQVGQWDQLGIDVRVMGCCDAGLMP